MLGRKLLAWPASSELAVDKPSIMTRWSLPLLPWMVIDPAGRVDDVRAAHVLVVECSSPESESPSSAACVRSECRSGPLVSSTRCRSALWTSTIGDSLVTVIVSSIGADLQLDVHGCGETIRPSSMPSRWTVLNPVSANVTA